MKTSTIILILLLPFTIWSQTGFRVNETEFFTISVSIDPIASYKEKGIDFVGEIEYAGKIYAKAGFESFTVLHGGYFDIHGAVGVNFTSGMWENVRYYIGVRPALVFRDNSQAMNIGAESGIDFCITENFTLGLRATLDKRNEQKVIFNWKPENKLSGFVRFGYRWDWKK